MICGSYLKYLDVGQEFTCIKCGTKEIGHVICPNGHYVCDSCHGKSAFESIVNMACETKECNPLLIAEDMIVSSGIPMLGCEHAWIAAGALMAAMKNTKKFHITPIQIREALRRTRRQALSAYCGLTGVCGIVPAIGSVFSVILKASCPKRQETATTMFAAAKIMETIAKEAGPSCCKHYVRIALTVSCQLVERYLGVVLPVEMDIICADSQRHPFGCRGERCGYYERV